MAPRLLGNNGCYCRQRNGLSNYSAPRRTSQNSNLNSHIGHFRLKIRRNCVFSRDRCDWKLAALLRSRKWIWGHFAAGKRHGKWEGKAKGRDGRPGEKGRTCS